MSLRWRIMGATVLVVVLTVAVSVGVGYYATQARLGVFVAQIGGEEAVQLAQNLSREYTVAGGWETVDRALSEAGYPYERSCRRENDPKKAKAEHLESFRPRPGASRHHRHRWTCGEGQPVPAANRNGRAGPGRAPGDGVRLGSQPARGLRLRGREPRAAIHRVARVPQHAPLHHPDWRSADGRRCYPAGRMVVQADHRPRDRFDEGDPGDCPGGYGPAAGHLLRRAGTE